MVVTTNRAPWLRRRRIWGILLVLAGVGLTIVLTFLGNVDDPPSASNQALLALLAISAQIGAAWVFNGEGKPDPTMARRSVARLVRLATRVEGARLQAQAASGKGTAAADVREAVGLLSVHLSYIEEGVVESIDDWRAFYSEAVEEVEKTKRERSADDE